MLLKWILGPEAAHFESPVVIFVDTSNGDPENHHIALAAGSNPGEPVH